MTLEEIEIEWGKDININRDDMVNEIYKTPKLHHKYWKIYSRERKQLKLLENELSIIKYDKKEFLTYGISREDKDKGWKMPPKGRLLKSEAESYLDADKEIQEKELLITEQKIKIDYLSNIIDSIKYRNNALGLMLDWLKWSNGQN